MLGWLRRKPESLVDRWYRSIAEGLVPSSRWGWSYCGYDLQKVLGIPDGHPWPGFPAKGVHLVLFHDSVDWRWDVKLKPIQWQTPPGLPPWAIDDVRYFTRAGAVSALTRSIKMLDQAYTDPEVRTAMVERLAQEGGLSLAPTGNLSHASSRSSW